MPAPRVRTLSQEAPRHEPRLDAQQGSACPVLGVARQGDGLCTVLYGPWLCTANDETVALWLPYEATVPPQAGEAAAALDLAAAADELEEAPTEQLQLTAEEACAAPHAPAPTEASDLPEPHLLTADEDAALGAFEASGSGAATSPRPLPTVEALPVPPQGSVADAATPAHPRLGERVRAHLQGESPRLLAYERCYIHAFGAKRLAELDPLHRAAVRVHARNRASGPLTSEAARNLIKRTYVEAQTAKHLAQLAAKQEHEAHRRETVRGWLGFALLLHLILLLLFWSLVLMEARVLEEARSLILGPFEAAPPEHGNVKELTTDEESQEADASEELVEVEPREQPELAEVSEFAEPSGLEPERPEVVQREPLEPQQQRKLPPELTGLELASGATDSAATGGARAHGLNARRSGTARRAALRRYGGTPETEEAVQRGLAWLARQQLNNGSWDPQAVHAGARFRGASMHTVGYTGLALLCFLGAGHTHTRGEYQGVVSRGLDYLLQHRNPETGGFLAQDARLPGRTNLYDQGLALLALTEAYAMTGEQRFEQPIQAGLRLVERAQKERGGWDYTYEEARFNPRGRSDVSIAGWLVMAMRSALNAGFDVRRETWERTQEFVLLQTTREGDVRYAAQGNRLDDRRGVGITAVAALCRLYDRDVRQSREGRDAPAPLARTLQWLTDNPPCRKTHTSEGPSRRSPPNEWSSDHPFFHTTYYWYYGSLALFEYSGGTGPIWRRWNERMQEAIVPAQRTDGGPELEGSWDPVGQFWSRYWGRLGDTCMNILSLEIYYRHLPLYGAGDGQSMGRLVTEPPAAEAQPGTGPRGRTSRVERAAAQLHSPASSRQARLNAARLLANDRGYQARKALARALTNPALEREVRGRCAQLLGRMAAPEGLKPMQAALEKPYNEKIRPVILESLGGLNTPGAFDVLVEGLRNARSFAERDAAHAGLQALTHELTLPPDPEAWLAWREDNPHVNRAPPPTDEPR